MTYPAQCPVVYTNPDGMISASGYYRASTTQELANMLPPWMHLRENRNSIGQQFISSTSVHLKRLESTLNEEMKNKFIDTANVDEVDVLYRAKLPNNVNLTDASASGVRCIAAPSGSSPSGVNQIWIKEEKDLERFYYHEIPTRIEIRASGAYTEAEIGKAWNVLPSGVYDAEEKHVDVWGKKHDIQWASSGGALRKQDSETMEDYEVYPEDRYGTVVDLDFYKGNLWCLTSSPDLTERISNADIDDDDMVDITDWIDVDGVNGISSQVTFDGKSCMKLDSGTPAVEFSAGARQQDVGTFSNRAVFSFSIYHAALGTVANGDCFRFDAYVIGFGGSSLVTKIDSDGLHVSSGSYVNVLPGLISIGTWQEWTFDVNFLTNRVDIYLDKVLQISDVNCDSGVAAENGYVDFYQLGSTTANQITYIDWFKAGSDFLNVSPSSNYITILSAKTYSPQASALDLIAAYNITDNVVGNPTNLTVIDESNIYIKGTGEVVYEAHPRYDYFLLDKDNRYVYLIEDYRNSGVFISNT